MDFTVTQPSFHQALRLVTRAAPARAALPVLQSILLDTQPGRLTVQATDLELGITTTLPAGVAVPGRAAIPARVLSEYVANLPGEPLRLALDPDSHRVRLTCGRFAAALATLDPTEFPALPGQPATGDLGGAADLTIDLDARALREAIDRVAFAAARDASRPVLSTVLFSLAPDGLTLAAADSFRLARVCLPQVTAPARQLLVPVRAVTEFARLLPAAETAHLALAPDGMGLVLSVRPATTSLSTRLLDGRYPDIDRVVPTEWRTRLTVEAAGLRRAARVAGLFGGDGDGRPVLLDAQPGWLRLRTRGDDTGEARTELPAAVEGQPQTVVLNARLLAEVLDAVAGAQLEVSWANPHAPVTVRAVGQGQAADLWLLMPLADAALARQTDQL